MNKVRTLAEEKPVELPDSKRVLRGNLAAHLGNKDRGNPHLGREITHVIFPRRHCPSDEE
jgi:hypothetical protein